MDNNYQYYELLLTDITKHTNDKSLHLIDNLFPLSKWIREKSPAI